MEAPILTFAQAARAENWYLSLEGAAFEFFRLPIPCHVTLSIGGVIETAPGELDDAKVHLVLEVPAGPSTKVEMPVSWPNTDVMSTRRRYPFAVTVTLQLQSPGILAAELREGDRVLNRTEVTVHEAAPS